MVLHYQIIKKFRQKRNDFDELVEENLIYMIESLKDYLEITRNGKINREKIVVKLFEFFIRLIMTGVVFACNVMEIGLLKYPLQNVFLKI